MFIFNRLIIYGIGYIKYNNNIIVATINNVGNGWCLIAAMTMRHHYSGLLHAGAVTSAGPSIILIIIIILRERESPTETASRTPAALSTTTGLI